MLFQYCLLKGFAFSIEELCILGYSQVSMYVMGLFLDLLLIPQVDLSFAIRDIYLKYTNFK